MNLFQDTQAIDGVHADAVIDVAQHPQSGTPKVVQYRDYGAPSHGRKSRRSAEPKTVSINSFRCRVWERHARLEEYITEETCRTEIASVKAHGQLIPVLVRPLLGDVNYDYELIYGARRLFVARHLNVPLLAEVRRLSDRDAAIHVDIENRQRKDISPYERGRCYHQWLSSGLFQSQEELSRTIRVSTAQVSRLLKLARLPSVILNAFDSPTSLCETWGAELLSVWGDPEQQRHMAARARTIANDAARPQASVIYERLLEGTRKRRRNKERDDVVVDDRGKALFRVRYQRRGVSFIVPRERASQALVERVKLNLSLVLQAETLQAAENLRRNDSESS